jgi:hypothetical protein
VAGPPDAVVLRGEFIDMKILLTYANMIHASGRELQIPAHTLVRFQAV